MLYKHKINVVVGGGNLDHNYIKQIESFLGHKVEVETEWVSDILRVLANKYLVLNDNWIKESDTHITCLRTCQKHKIIAYKEISCPLPTSAYKAYDGAISPHTSNFSCIKVENQHLIRNNDKIVGHWEKF